VCAHQHVASARSLAGEHPLFAWEETQFSTWALYSSSLRIKLMPLQYAGQQGRQWKAGDGHALIWDNGRLLLHSASVRHSATDLRYLIVLSCHAAILWYQTPVQIETKPVPSGRIDEPLVPRGTWDAPQKPGSWVVEKLGNERVLIVNCSSNSFMFLHSSYFFTFMHTTLPGGLLTLGIRFVGEDCVVRVAPRSPRLRSADTGIHHVPLQLRTRRQGT
jgi:hypothetical protein